MTMPALSMATLAPGAHGDADASGGLGLREGGGVVDAVADHGGWALLRCAVPDEAGLVFGGEGAAGVFGGDSQALREGADDFAAVAGEQRGLDAACAEGVDQARRIVAGLIPEGDGAEDVAVADDHAHAGVVGHRGHLEAPLASAVGGDDLDAGAAHHAP
ncbi:MAG: hypothetical protein IPJ41_04990 [Phycisphaerales bacterium]|nr:hypothetical protein [Phycisphaerales bacterium]